MNLSSDLYTIKKMERSSGNKKKKKKKRERGRGLEFVNDWRDQFWG